MIYTTTTHRDDILAGYWLTVGDDRQPYWVIPDGCVDWVCELSASGARWFVFGTATAATLQPLQTGARYFGIRFKPGQAGLAISLPVAALTDASQTVELPLTFSSRDTWLKMVDKANRFVETLPTQHPAATETVDSAIQLLQQHQGQLTIPSLAQQLAISDRQLNRLFRRAVGLSPKHYGRIVRFQSVCQQLQRAETSIAEVAITAGYTDQAHLCKEFKQLMGITPRTYYQGRPKFNGSDFYGSDFYKTGQD